MNQGVLNIDDLQGLSKITEGFCRLGEDYIICRITPQCMIPYPERDSRIAGLVFCLVTHGFACGELDTESFELREGNLMIFSRWNSLRFNYLGREDFHAELLFVSETFIHDINIDLNALNMHSLFDSKPKPVMDELAAKELQIIADVFALLRHNAELDGETIYTRNIARSALQCLVYLLLQAHATRSKTSDASSSLQNRRVGYVHEFMQLLQLHHTRHRNITFYADKLHISPKYLSHIIKEATGKSATDWIGEFVVREAKNMLRFTNKNVQQVAYALNFSTQSSFGKFFKHITGMSPSEFQKS